MDIYGVEADNLIADFPLKPSTIDTGGEQHHGHRESHGGDCHLYSRAAFAASLRQPDATGQKKMNSSSLQNYIIPPTCAT